MKEYRGLWIISALLLIVILGFSLSITTMTTAQGATFGVNWQGQFANNTSRPFVGPPLVSPVYPNGLNFNWAGVPTDANNLALAGIGADNFSARFTSSQAFQAGTYNFTLVVDDQATVTIGGIPVLDAPVPGTYNFAATFPATGNYSLQVDLVELTQTAILQFFWTLTGGTFPPGTTPGTPGVVFTPTPSGPQANVVNVRGLALRTGPYLGASYISVLRPDIAYSVLARNDDEGGGYTWFLINTGEREGWSSGRYLTLNVDPLSLPVRGTVFDTLGNPPDRGVIAIPRAVMNLRRRPSVRAVRIGQIPWGAETQLLGRTIQGGQNFWYLVRYNGVVGWIYAPYITVRGNLNSVPVY